MQKQLNLKEQKAAENEIESLYKYYAGINDCLHQCFNVSIRN